MLKKIHKVITSCHDCEHCKKTTSNANNFTRGFICFFKYESDPVQPRPFLLHYTESGVNNELLIPNNCPLEDYKETEK